MDYEVRLRTLMLSKGAQALAGIDGEATRRTHDDQVDLFSMAAHEVIRHGEQNWDAAYDVRRCECGTACSAMVHESCPSCGKASAVSEQPDLKVLPGTEAQESWYPEPSKPDALEQLAAFRAWAGRR